LLLLLLLLIFILEKVVATELNIENKYKTNHSFDKNQNVKKYILQLTTCFYSHTEMK